MTKCKLSIKSFCFRYNILIPVEKFISTFLYEKSYLVELQVPSLVVVGAVVAGLRPGVVVAVLRDARHGLRQQTGVSG